VPSEDIDSCEVGRSPSGLSDTAAFMHYFSAKESGNAEQLKTNEPKRLELYNPWHL
jgi:hypothetical protein